MHFDESQLLQDLAELEIPLPASLLETVDGLPEEAVEFLTSWAALLEARRRFHVHYLLQVGMQVGSGDVH